MKKINFAGVRINTEKREVVVSILAHRSTNYSAIKGCATKQFKKSREVFKYWISLNEPVFYPQGIIFTHQYLQEGYRFFEVKFSVF